LKVERQKAVACDVNFGGATLNEGLHRIVNGYVLYPPPPRLRVSACAGMIRFLAPLARTLARTGASGSNPRRLPTSAWPSPGACPDPHPRSTGRTVIFTLSS
jgi:hypothetical protein